MDAIGITSSTLSIFHFIEQIMRSKSPQLIGTDVDSLDDEKIEAYHAKSAHPSFRSRAVVFDCSNESVDITSRDCIDEGKQ